MKQTVWVQSKLTEQVQTICKGYSQMTKVDTRKEREHSAILSTFIKLPFIFKTFVLSIFEWPLKTGFTVVH